MAGFNFRMAEVQAAALNVKLDHILDWTEQRRAIAAQYDSLLSDVSAISTPKTQAHKYHVYHLYVLKMKNVAERDSLMEFLNAAGVQTGIHYPYMLHGHPHIDMTTVMRTPSEDGEWVDVENPVLSLPIYPGMDMEQIEYVSDKIHEWSESK